MPDGLKVFLYILRAIVLAVLGAVVLLNLYGIYMQVIFNSDYPTIFGISRYIPDADYPDYGISKNDYLITVDFLGYDQGDVILCENAEKVFSVDKIAKNADGNIYLVSNVNDPIGNDQIIRGEVFKNIKGIGEYMLMVESPIGIVIMALMIILVYEIPRLFSGMNSKKSVREKRF